MSAALLEVQDLAIHAGQITLLQGASLSLQAGQRLTVVGESGAGKSLLAQAIMGTLPVPLQASGSIRIQGLATNGLRETTLSLWGKTITMLPQEPWTALNPLMRMQAQVAEAAHFSRSLAWQAARDTALAHMQQLGIAPAAHKWLHQISGGMAQRVGVATSAVSGAQLLIADEPTKGLDPSSKAQVAELLLSTQAAGQALLTITHDLALAALLGGQLLVLQGGRVVESGLVQEVLAAPQHPYTRELLAAQPHHWPRLYSQASASAASQTVVHGTGLAKRFGTQQLFENLSLKLQRGQVMSVSGASGCGKTTLGNILLGLVNADSGQVQRSAHPRWKFQKLYQDPPSAFAPTRRLRDALQDLVQLHGLDSVRCTQRIEHLLQSLSLEPALLDRLPSQVSGGELQRVALLRLLLLEPVFIFADEPTSRLDVITQFETMKLLVAHAQSQDCGLLLVTHDQDIARACASQSLAL
jgi:ABC-type glutathione transport system ATPase component